MSFFPCFLRASTSFVVISDLEFFLARFAGLGGVWFAAVDAVRVGERMRMQTGLEPWKPKRAFPGLFPTGDLGSALRCCGGSR